VLAELVARRGYPVIRSARFGGSPGRGPGLTVMSADSGGVERCRDALGPRLNNAVVTQATSGPGHAVKALTVQNLMRPRTCSRVGGAA